MWYFVALVWIALVAGIFWAYGRKRNRAVSERAKELSALISEAKTSARTAADTPQPGPATIAKPVVVASAETYARKSKLLGKSDAWLYFLFRTGLPDHEIFANVALSDIVDAAPAMNGFDREQIVRKLSQTFLNVVVCNKQLEIVAVVLYPNADTAGAAAQNYAESCLHAAGIRIVRIEPTALPRHHQVRALVYGDAAQPAS
jgi:hypothetical protein